MSQLRQNLVSGDWIILAPERAKRPHDFLKKNVARVPSDIATCPFEDLEATGNWPPVVALPKVTSWEAVIIPNKFPALLHGPVCAQKFSHGPFSVMEGIGRHELLIGRNHTATLAELPASDALRLFLLLQNHYQRLKTDPCLLYASTFFNWGPTAGASLYHPHYQIVSLPIIPPDVQHSLRGSSMYFSTHQQCVHCTMIEFEREQKSRVIFETEHAIAFAPYASAAPFEVRVFPKQHGAVFEDTPRDVLIEVVGVLASVLAAFTKNLEDPDRNFFIHTAPFQNQKAYDYYHWHIEVVPKIAIAGGFELSTGVDINVIDPDFAASSISHGIH